MLIVHYTHSASAQDTTKKAKIFSYVEHIPEPSFNISDYISQHLTYPENARKANIEGRVIVKFIVDNYGYIDSVHVLHSVYPSLDSAAIAVISNMPRWKPGKQNGRAVNVYFTLPIQFKLK